MASPAGHAYPAIPTPPSGGDERVVLRDVDWKTYCAVRELFDGPGVRMTYLEPDRHRALKAFRDRLRAR